MSFKRALAVRFPFTIAIPKGGLRETSACTCFRTLTERRFIKSRSKRATNFTGKPLAPLAPLAPSSYGSGETDI